MHSLSLLFLFARVYFSRWFSSSFRCLFPLLFLLDRLCWIVWWRRGGEAAGTILLVVHQDSGYMFTIIPFWIMFFTSLVCQKIYFFRTVEFADSVISILFMVNSRGLLCLI